MAASVCFPVYDEKLRQEIRSIVDLQLRDNASAVIINEHLNNVPVVNGTEIIHSQDAIYELLSR